MWQKLKSIRINKQERIIPLSYIDFTAHNKSECYIEGIFIDYNKRTSNKIELSQQNIDRYNQGWTLSEIANGKEIYILQKNIDHCPGVITYISNED